MPEIRWPERLDGVVPYRHRPARRLSQLYANDTADFRLVVAFSYAAGAIELRGPVALSIFFICRSFTRPPPRVPPVRIASPTHPPPPTPSFGWLLHISIKRQPPKTGTPPISQFFHGGHLGAQNKGTKRSVRKPGRRAPLLGSWGAAAPRFGSVADVAMEREGKAAGGIVGWQRLICVVCGGRVC